MKYFGTDGIRGAFGVTPVCKSCLNRLARALEAHLKLKHVVIGRDTRASGVAITDFLVSGFTTGAEIIDVGVVSSPLLSQAILETQADCGLMVTASHNPAADNGVKVLDAFGGKISSALEYELEKLMNSFPQDIENTGHKIEKYEVHSKYIEAPEIFEQFPKVVIDCANGSAVDFAKKSYHFPKIIWLGDQPDGENINDHCGSEHPELLVEKVKEENAILGIAHDGDGDRLVLCDRFGSILPGEAILGIIAIFLENVGRLSGHKIITTAMSNYGLKFSLNKYDIQVEEADIGDRNVADKMRSLGCNFGGESSGHVIFFDEAPTSDGIQTALLFLKAVTFLKIDPAQSGSFIQLLPKKICNIPVKKKIPLENIPSIQRAIELAKKELGAQGRIFIRYSGTESKLRLLVEAETEEKAGEVFENMKNSIASCEEIV